MQRRGQELTDIHTTLFNVLYDQTAAQRKQALREGEQRRLRQIL
jgi:hypothetical protein